LKGRGATGPAIPEIEKDCYLQIDEFEGLVMCSMYYAPHILSDIILLISVKIVKPARTLCDICII
jgi:hypothetical protein